MIINSLLDTDLYKLTMMQLIYHHFPHAVVEYQFKCRTENIDLSPYLQEIQQEINQLYQLRFTTEDINYLATLPFFHKDFLHLLSTFTLKPEHLIIENGAPLRLTIQGPWVETILFEVPLLAIINEIYMRHQPNGNYSLGKQRLQQKIALIQKQPTLQSFSFIDFGTRRRFSFAWHQEIIKILSTELPHNFCGTSNIYLARQFNLSPAGTMAHEYIQGCQVLGPNLLTSQKYALELWRKEYGNYLNIALTDTYTLSTFLHDFDTNLATAFAGLRQDSGDPFYWGERILSHYQKMQIDPKTKKLIFSDSLTFPLAIKLYNHFQHITNPLFGIGTNLTNDLGPEPIQIVLKITECNGRPVAKISDTPTKETCKDAAYLAYLKKIFL